MPTLLIASLSRTNLHQTQRKLARYRLQMTVKTSCKLSVQPKRTQHLKETSLNEVITGFIIQFV